MNRPPSPVLRRHVRRSAFGLLLAICLGSWPASVLAQDPNDPSPHSNASLISEVTSIQPGTPFTVAVRIELDPGWHNYWKNAGDSGLPTAIQWTLPPGFQAGEIQWPVPERIVGGPLVDYGYSDEVMLLVEVTSPETLSPGSTARLEALVDWLVCKSICLPAFQEVSLELEVSAAPPMPDPEWRALFQATRERLPRALDTWSVAAEVTETGYRLVVDPDGGDTPLPESVYFFASESSVIAHAAPQARTVEGDRLILEIQGSPYARQPSGVLRGVLHAEEGGAWDSAGSVGGLLVAATVEGAPAQEAPAEGEQDAVDVTAGSGAAAAGSVTVGLAILFAFAGGLILNLMPCVFPILSLKILGAAGQGGEDRARIRNQGWMFALGVVLAFVALGGLLVALRAGGAQLGWGFQLQSPLFVALMALLFFAIGLNLMGVFEIGTSLTRIGGRVGESGGYGESLASGVLATFIATPCTAPFMGAALGYAVTRSVPETLLIFGFLGAGMALPYLVLSVAPGLLERLPRPGPWMETLRQVLAFPMFATVIWLTWVFGQQTGMGGTAYLLSGLLAVSAAGWMVNRWYRTDLRSGIVARVVSVLCLLGAGLLVLRGSRLEAPLMAIQEGWAPFTQAEVGRTLAEGRPVFVDFTAAWCLTCQVNERVVLSTETVQNAFRERNVALFKADWTRQDPEITAALEALERNGVPVYALYAGRPGSAPHLLPALLTEQIVLNALEEFISP